jgi:hypothetical protein
MVTVSVWPDKDVAWAIEFKRSVDRASNRKMVLY